MIGTILPGFARLVATATVVSALACEEIGGPTDLAPAPFGTPADLTGASTSCAAPAHSSPGPRLAASPDGRRVAWVREGADGATDIWIATTDGTDLRRVSHLGYRRPHFDRMEWSGDSRTLLTSIADDDPLQRDVVVVDVEDGTVTPVTAAIGREWDAEWSPDGSTVLFSAASDGVVQRFAVPASGGAWRPLGGACPSCPAAVVTALRPASTECEPPP